MILGIVKGTVYSTRKMDDLKGLKFLLVEPVNGTKKDTFVAGDTLGAGIGETVLVTQNSSVQYALSHTAPIDAFVVGIVDPPSSSGKK